MTDERRRQIESLYRAAANLDARQRAAFLAEACRGEAELRREIETLLADKSAESAAAPGARFGP